uniref:Coat protein n=1 Tax=Phasmatodean tombus-related virus TaxID=2822558 RepID=A0A8A6RT25_9TOMB|nr:hypothetical protein [Phasmatodean tombus-related virus]
MTLNPYTARGRRGIPWGALAAQTVYGLGRAAYNYAMRPPPPVVVVQGRQRGQNFPLPSYAPPQGATPRTRGRRRRARGRGAPAMRFTQGARSVMGNEGMRIRETESWLTYSQATKDATGFKQFCPGASGLSRLDAIARIHGSYRINRVQVIFNSTAPTTEASQAVWGVLPGIAQTIGPESVSKLKPGSIGPAWKTTSIQMGNEAQIGKLMKCNAANSDDSVAFTLYYRQNSTATDIGVFQVAYDITFLFPRPN